MTAIDPIGRAKTPVLVFAVSGRTGSGASFVANALTEELKAFGYACHRIKVAKDFLENLNAVKAWMPDPALSAELFDGISEDLFSKGSEAFSSFLTQHHLAEDMLSDKSRRIMKLQRRGDILRKAKGNSFLAALCIDKICKQVKSDHHERKAFIIDSLKHPDEVSVLRTVFQNAFCMIGAVADDTVRKQRLNDQKNVDERVFEAISDIDSGETQDRYGQHATETILRSDYFFENNYDKPTRIKVECARLLNLLFQCEIETPRLDEYGMHLAHMAADRSACLSRQVGAALLSESGTVLATGHNDVPEYGGGLYSTESTEDYRCFAKSAKCHNDEEKQLLADQIVAIFRKKGLDISDSTFIRMKEILLKETRLKLLIEFSRAVHAEMDVIITVARDAKPGLVGSTMYVTTYPCHNCAKHIIDAGIRRVVFLEPYSKSLAQKLHPDAINDPREAPTSKKVTFANYGGVAPERFASWFSKQGDRKKDGRMIRKSMQKDTMLPLHALEVSQFDSLSADFEKWFLRINKSANTGGEISDPKTHGL